MAQNMHKKLFTTDEFNQKSWVELTNSDAAEVSFQVLTGLVEVVATVGAVPPSSDAVGWQYPTKSGELKEPMATFSNAEGASRLFARALAFPSEILTDHA